MNWCISDQMSRNVRKDTFLHVRPARTQISLRIRAVWSESSLFARRNVASFLPKNAASEDSDQTARMRRLVWIFAGRTCPRVRFLTLRCNWCWLIKMDGENRQVRTPLISHGIICVTQLCDMKGYTYVRASEVFNSDWKHENKNFVWLKTRWHYKKRINDTARIRIRNPRITVDNVQNNNIFFFFFFFFFAYLRHYPSICSYACVFTWHRLKGIESTFWRNNSFNDVFSFLLQQGLL